MKFSFKTSYKLSCVQFVCALMIIGLHTIFFVYFKPAAEWTLTLNRLFRNVLDASIPTFFFLSAVLLFRSAETRTYLQVLRSKSQTLLLPYILWNALFMLHQWIHASLSAGQMQPISLLRFLDGCTLHPANSIFWFFQVLMLLTLLYPLLLWLLKKNGLHFCWGSSARLSALCRPLPSPIDPSSTGCPST